MQTDKAAFGVRVVDGATGRGVPLAELETVHRVLFVTDSNGWAAVREPGLTGREVFFHVRSHGYTFPKDGFGFAGVRLRVTPGGRATVTMKRENVAERLCRLTGEGIYADSVTLGEKAPLQSPTLAGGVLGQDSAQTVVYRGRMLWFWGDTNLPNYPLGNFRMSGAVATLPQGETTGDRGLDFRYFTRPDGFAREMCPSPKPGPIWISGLVVLKEAGRERLLAYYTRMKDLGTRLEHGYVEWDDAREIFRFVRELPNEEKWRVIEGHLARFAEKGTEYLAGGFCFPVVRVPARRDALLDPAACEAFTCLTPGGEVARDASGKAAYAWRKDAPPVTSEREDELVKAGKLRRDEARFLPRDPSGRDVVLHGGGVTWNPWRKKWLLVATRRDTKESALGEIVYGEADHPTGPWRHAVPVLAHDRYTFYNPVHHPFLDAQGGKVIYFEGTYTEQFSGNPRPTPRYDYNQILYRLDLSDPRLRPAQQA